MFVMSKYEAPKYENYEFPLLANIGGWCISLSTLAPLFIFAIYRIIVNKTVSVHLNLTLGILRSKEFKREI